MKIRTLPRRLRLAVQQTSHLVLVASLLSLIAWTPEAGAADIYPVFRELFRKETPA